jgi:hypothetical protein
MDNHQGVFRDLERFVGGHRHCGSLSGYAEQPRDDGYLVWVVCSCGASFERWVTPEAAEYDLVRSRLLTSQN